MDEEDEWFCHGVDKESFWREGNCFCNLWLGDDGGANLSKIRSILESIDLVDISRVLMRRSNWTLHSRWLLNSTQIRSNLVWRSLVVDAWRRVWESKKNSNDYFKCVQHTGQSPETHHTTPSHRDWVTIDYKHTSQSIRSTLGRSAETYPTTLSHRDWDLPVCTYWSPGWELNPRPETHNLGPEPLDQGDYGCYLKLILRAKTFNMWWIAPFA